MKLGPYKHEQRWHNWKARINNKLPNLSDANSELILNYLSDMEKGMNVSSKSVKGSRSFSRLNSLRNRMTFFAKKFKELYNLDNTENCPKPRHLCRGSCKATSSFLSPKIPNKPHTLVCGKTQEFFDITEIKEEKK